MIKKVTGIAALFLVIFVIAIGITKANPPADKPFATGPDFFAAARPGGNLRGFFLKPSYVRPATLEEDPFKTSAQPVSEKRPAPAGKTRPKHNSPRFSAFPNGQPDTPVDDPAKFDPGV